ncbi:hypothetical protein [Williamsia sterculiae]|uniref:hypothetical protein n=1 Tax=Williamsia sterculiae TaxID=1344003 RepID=UPI00117F6B5C|nr:hypothetical protein [Williamsia sterculiae]
MGAGMFTEVGDLLVDQLGVDSRVVDDVDADIVDAIRGAVRLRAVTDHLLAVVAAQAERVGVAKRSGMTVRELLVANGMAPVAADRCLRVGRAGNLRCQSRGVDGSGACGCCRGRTRLRGHHLGR